MYIQCTFNAILSYNLLHGYSRNIFSSKMTAIWLLTEKLWVVIHGKSIRNVFNIHSSYIQYTCYLAYANSLTHSLSYPKSRDAIASNKKIRWKYSFSSTNFKLEYLG